MTENLCFRSKNRNSNKDGPIGEEIECMCMECGASNYLPADAVTMNEQEGTDSKLLDSLLVCQNCGGQLKLIGRAGDEPFYRLS